jgi:hypothetical protein
MVVRVRGMIVKIKFHGRIKLDSDVMAQPGAVKKPAKSDRICHVNTRDRPFYKLEFGGAYIFYIENLMGIISAIGAFLITMLAVPTPRDAVTVALGILLGVAFLLGYAMTRLLAFMRRDTSIKRGLYCAAVSGCHFIGTTLAWGWIQVDSMHAWWLGVPLIAVAWCSLVYYYRKYGKIGLFTDGMRIGSMTFMYPDIIAVGHGTGADIEAKIPPEGKGKPMKILTPIEFEYLEDNFGIFHVYLILVTADAVYVAQSINKQSNLAQDTRNAWSRCVLGHE